MNIKLSLWERAQKQLQHFYRVRLTNIYKGSNSDIVKRYPTELEALEAIIKWERKAVGNTGILISTPEPRKNA